MLEGFMWEVELCCDIENKRIINYIFKMMKAYVNDKSCVLTTLETDDNIKILFACALGKKDYYVEMIKVCIIDYIINVFKYEYLIKNISNFMKDDISFKSFIKLLSLYDKQTDEQALKKSIKIDKCFYIDRFLQFRMTPLITHWKEFCVLASENFDYFINTESFLDMMRFLIATMEESCDKIKILAKNGSYSIYNIDSNFDCADKIDECYTTFSLISAVLKICPKNIDVYLDNNVVDDAIKFLQEVYIDRVCLIEL